MAGRFGVKERMMTIRGTPTTGLLGATLGFFVGFAAVSLFGPTVTYLQTAAGLSAGLAGLLISIPNLTGSLLRIPFSAMVDRNGGRASFLILLALSVVGVAGIWAVITFGEGSLRTLFPLLLVLGALGGCGIATFSVGISQTAYWFPQSGQGTALGAYAGIGNLAPGIFALLLGILVPRIGLDGSYLAWLGFLVVGIAAYLRFGRNAPYFQLVESGADPTQARASARAHGQELFPTGKVRETLATSARRWQTWALVAVYFTTFGGFIALTGWFPKYWVSYFGLHLPLAGVLTAVFSISASLLRVAGGPISDRIGGELTAALSLIVLLAGTTILGLSVSITASVVGISLTAIGMGVGNAAVFKLVPQEVPDAVAGAAGWVGGLGAFGGFVIPNLLALFVRSGETGHPGFARGFLIFIVLVAISLTMIGMVRAGRRRRETEQSRRT